MSLTLRQKQSLYHSLALLVRTGIPLPVAFDRLAPTLRGNARRLVEAARKSIAARHTAGEAFAAQSAMISPLEIAIVSAVEKSGQLDRGFSELSEYFGALNLARIKVRDQCLYPLFLLHFGILVLNLPTMILKTSQQYWRDVGTAFFFFYGAIIIIALAIPLLREFGVGTPVVDRLLNFIPLLGGIRRSFALSRFCTVYGLQLDAGINVIDSVISAGRSSLSGWMRSAVDDAVPQIRLGSQVGPLLAASDAFPSDLTQAVILGEETGSLDDELRRMAKEYRDQALRALERFANLAPKIIYMAIVSYLLWKILGLVQGIIAPYYKMGLGE